MSRYHSYLNSAEEILRQYDGGEPFVSFLKKYFSTNKKHGSTDRKQIGHLCYCYFRLGKMEAAWLLTEKILAGLFLCSNEPQEILQQLQPAWNGKESGTPEEKLSLLSLEDAVADIFPFKHALSDSIDKQAFILSHLRQPDVFLRLRPGKEEIVKEKLQKAGIDFAVISDNSLVLANSSKADTVIKLNKEAVVQDYSSQQVAHFLSAALPQPPGKVWDCCAGSGGKSIMLYDLYPGIDLTVSDIRESIMVNLTKRFSEAGISKYTGRVADLTRASATTEWPAAHFQLIVADVPCSGSGTWGRSPEQLSYFKEEKIDEYVSLQKKIVAAAIPKLQGDGYFLYITCSVFKKENEEMVAFIQQQFPFHLIKMETLKGYDKKADTMFAALLQKTL